MLAQITQSAAPAATIALGDPGAAILFYLFAALTLGGAFTAAFSSDLRKAGGALLVTIAGMAALFLLLHAEFLAAVEILVSGGATLVILLLGLALTRRRNDASAPIRRAEAAWAIILSATIAIALVSIFLRTSWPATSPNASLNTPSAADLGTSLIAWQGPDAYLAAFELFAILLLIVMVGAAYLARARRYLPSAPPPIKTLAPSASTRERTAP